METIVNQLGETVAGVPPVLQFLGLLVIGFVPFLESYVGALVGVVAGLPVAVALPAAVVGNLLALAVAVWAGSGAARKVRGRRQEPPTERRRKILARVDRYGVPVASLVAPTVMAISITAFVMVAAGLDRRSVIIWQSVAVVAWGVVSVLLGLGLLAAVT